MALIRPDLSALAWRWREMLAGVGLALSGVWAALGASGILAWLGWLALPVGLILAAGGVQRARFRRAGNGPGVVRVTEGQISYFGPLTGGVVACDALEALTLDPTGKPIHWRFDHDFGPVLLIPVTAKNAEELFDAFEQLPGLDMHELLKWLENPPPHPVVLWRRSNLRLS